MTRTRGRILVVDESPEGFQQLAQIFEHEHYEVQWASTGSDGIRLAESLEPDVIMLDFHLQTMGGLDLCRNLRLRNSTWSIPIILLTTGQVEEAAVARALELGANDCVSRPLRRAELLGRVGVLLRMKRVEDKLRRLYLERTRELEWSNMELQKIRTQLILKNQMSRLGLMVAVTAHEIRSPAASISGNLELTQTLMEDLVEALGRLPDVFAQASKADLARYTQLMRQLMVVNLAQPPVDMVSRRREARRIEEALEGHLETPLSDQLLNQLAKFRLGEALDELVPLVQQFGLEALSPLLHLGELLVKLKNMQLSIERINGIVKAMKAYSHLDRQEQQDVSVQEGLEDTLTIMNYIFRGSVELVRRFAPDLPRIPGFPGELNQVWTNLLQNAFDAIEGGKGQIVVETALEADRAILVRITDTGRGIPKEILPHIFDSFFTTKDKGKGSGLGLDICRQIVEKHQGSIEVSSVPGSTTFSVRLPLARGSEKKTRTPGSSPGIDVA